MRSDIQVVICKRPENTNPKVNFTSDMIHNAIVKAVAFNVPIVFVGFSISPAEFHFIVKTLEYHYNAKKNKSQATALATALGMLSAAKTRPNASFGMWPDHVYTLLSNEDLLFLARAQVRNGEQKAIVNVNAPATITLDLAKRLAKEEAETEAVEVRDGHLRVHKFSNLLFK